MFFSSNLLFSDTKYCESILSPTDYSLTKSLEATLITGNKKTYLDEKDHVDLCCRSFQKCDSYKHIELNHNQTTELHIRHCDCVHYCIRFKYV